MAVRFTKQVQISFMWLWCDHTFRQSMSHDSRPYLVQVYLQGTGSDHNEAHEQLPGDLHQLGTICKSRTCACTMPTCSVSKTDQRLLHRPVLALCRRHCGITKQCRCGTTPVPETPTMAELARGPYGEFCCCTCLHDDVAGRPTQVTLKHNVL